MSGTTLVVVGLDAADYELARRWDCRNILLENHDGIETFAHTKEYPITAEVWPAIATGRTPDEGGQAGQRGSDWDGVMGLANAAARLVLPQATRARIGRYLRNGREVDDHFGPTDDDHVFAAGAVYNWPGITPAQNWARSEHWLDRFDDGELSDLEFLRRQMAFTGEELGWALGMSRTWLPMVGTRCHVLDHAGHAWANQEEKLRTAYEMVDGMVERLRGDPAVGEVVVVSDHGMQVGFADDPDPGTHSWRAMVSTTLDGPLPDHVRAVRSWLESEMPEPDGINDAWGESTMDTPTEHLRDLGYIE